MGPPFAFLSNRGSAIFRRALAPLGGRPFRDGDRHIHLLYLDRRGGKRPPPRTTVGFTLMHRRRTRPLDNKATMARALLDAGITYPRAYLDPLDVPDEPGSLWFIKDPKSTGGKGMVVARREDVADHFRPGDVIQEAVQDLLLIDGRKFTVRAHVLVSRGRVHLFSAASAVVHGAPYDAETTDGEVQFAHDGYMAAGGPVEMTPLADFGFHAEVMRGLEPEMAAVFTALSGSLEGAPDHTYCLFGVDVLVKPDLSPVLIEINDRPNIVHPRRVNDEVNAPMVRSMCRVLDPARAALHPEGGPRFELVARL